MECRKNNDQWVKRQQRWSTPIVSSAICKSCFLFLALSLPSSSPSAFRTPPMLSLPCLCSTLISSPRYSQWENASCHWATLRFVSSFQSLGSDPLPLILIHSLDNHPPAHLSRAKSLPDSSQPSQGPRPAPVLQPTLGPTPCELLVASPFLLPSMA